MGWEKEPSLEKVFLVSSQRITQKTLDLSAMWTTFSLQSCNCIHHLPQGLNSCSTSTTSEEKPKQLKTCFYCPLFLFSLTHLTSSKFRQMTGLRAKTSKWHFYVCASRVKQHATNLANGLRTIYITCLENNLSVSEFIRLLTSFLSYSTCITMRAVLVS